MKKQITQKEALTGCTIERVVEMGWGTAVILDGEKFFIVGIVQEYDTCHTHITGSLCDCDINQDLLDAGIVTKEEYAAQEAIIAQRQEQARIEREQAWAAIQERDRLHRARRETAEPGE